MTERFALYFAPPAHHPLWAAGCEWLGRDPESGTTFLGGARRGEPRRYGFHATLKAPFALREGVTGPQLLDALTRFADERAPFDMPALAVATLGDFIALRPADATTPESPLRVLADDCVRVFDELRRPPSTAELARRMRANLDAAQRANVERWGYPHVFDRWRFHMTLSDGLPADAIVGLLDEATRHFSAALAQPLRCDGVALFVEDAPGADFRLARRFRFAR